ncbi:MAG: O-methyltransferase, partial [Flammeovirgaceae bacterium]
ILDYGAGSNSGKRPQRSIGSIAKTAAKPARFGRLMYHLVQFYKVESVLELGTSLGMSTRYLAAALQKGSVVSIEGSPEIAKFTSSCLQQEGYPHVKIIEGEFDLRLPETLPSLIGRKLVFFDGNHRYEP